MKFRRQVYDDIKEYYCENCNTYLTDDDIDKLEMHQVIRAYLEWNGIFGYDVVITDIVKAF